ncbi:MAG: STAS domain-containing protein [Treponemataceae bacterium]
MSASSVSVKVVTWEGSPSVEKAAALKEGLVAALAQAAQVVVSLSLMDSIDLAAIQLLIAAQREAEKTGKTFHLTGTIKPDLAHALIVSGFIRKPSENARDIDAELFGMSVTTKKES